MKTGVSPVYFFSQGKNLFSSPGNPVMKTGFSPVWEKYTGKTLF
jgi:hypothetical protein